MQAANASVERVTPLENPAVNGPWICNKGRDLARIFERPRAEQAMLKGRPVEVPEAIDQARRLIGAARHPAALVSNWGSNEELEAFKTRLGEIFHCFVKRDWQAEEGERIEDDLLIRADKNPNTGKARELFHDAGEPAFHDGTDLVLVWGEGFDFAKLPRGARVIYLNSYLQPENGHADVFFAVSIQTERRGHYTNFQGTVSAFEPCFERKPGVVDAEALFVALAAPARGHP
jgi:NADH-quinone oxidoreductase subunit G